MPALGDLVVHLKADSSDFNAKMRGASGGINDFALAAAAGAAAIGGIFAYSAKTFMDYDDAIRAVAAVTGTSGTPAFEQMNQVAKELGATTSFTAVEVAKLMTELGRAGFDPAQINAMTTSVLSLSRATGTDAAESAGIMSATIHQFGLEASDAARVADVLTMTSSKTFNTVGQLGEAFGYVGLVMKELKIPLEDAAAALGILGNVGIQGSAAGNAFKRFALLTTAEAEKMEGIFHVSFKGANGSIMSLIDTLETLQGSLGKMDDATAIKSLNDAFGMLGITGAAALASAGDGVKDLRDQLLHAQGAAAKMAAEMDAGLGGAFRRMGSAAEALRIEIGRRLAPILSFTADMLSIASGKAVRFASVLVPLSAGFMAVAVTTLAVVAAMKAYAIATRLALALSGPKGWAILAVGLGVAAGAAALMAGEEEKLATATAAANAELKAGTQATKDFGAAAQAASPDVTDLATSTQSLEELLSELETPAKKIADTMKEFKTALIAASEEVIWDGHPLVIAMLEHESGFTSAMSTITDELAILRGEATRTGIELQAMLDAGVNPAQVEQLRALYGEQEKIKEQSDKMIRQQKEKEQIADRQAAQDKSRRQAERDAAEVIMDAIRTPERVKSDEAMRVQALVDAGRLDQEAADQFLALKNGDSKGSGGSTGVMQRGSAEAFKTIMASGGTSPEFKEAQKQTALLKLIADKKMAKTLIRDLKTQGAV